MPWNSHRVAKLNNQRHYISETQYRNHSVTGKEILKILVTNSNSAHQKRFIRQIMILPNKYQPYATADIRDETYFGPYPNFATVSSNACCTQNDRNLARKTISHSNNWILYLAGTATKTHGGCVHRGTSQIIFL